MHYGSARHVNINPTFVVNGNRLSTVNVLHHEPRHGFQYQLVDDLEAGLLLGEEKAQAEIFAYNFDHYKRPRQHGYKAYREQPVEDDAFKYGEIAEKQFEELGKKNDRIFFDI